MKTFIYAASLCTAFLIGSACNAQGATAKTKPEGKGELLALMYQKPLNQEKIDAVLDEHKGDQAYLNHALFLAARGQASLIKPLLDRGAEVNAQNKHGNTPVHEAVSHFYPKALKLLVESGANLELANSKGKSPADLLKKRGYPDTNDKLLDALKDVKSA